MNKISITHLSERAVSEFKNRATLSGHSVEMEICKVLESATTASAQGGIGSAVRSVRRHVGDMEMVVRKDSKLPCAAKFGPRLQALAIRELFNAGLAREKSALVTRARMIEGLLSGNAIDADIAAVVNLALEVFESEEKAYHWLVAEQVGLMGRTPLALLAAGLHSEVHDVLAPMWVEHP